MLSFMLRNVRISKNKDALVFCGISVGDVPAIRQPSWSWRSEWTTVPIVKSTITNEISFDWAFLIGNS